jgi:hypothetical protein
LKLGLDIHGVIDADPVYFSNLTKVLVQAGWEIHIITGPTKEKTIPELLKWDIAYTHFFSIFDYHREIGTQIWFDDKNNPWMERETWDKTKGDYCNKNKITLHIDDTSRYGKYFKTHFALFKI